MKTNLMMNFSVDKEKYQIHVEREFAAAVDLVWTAWTEPKWLDQWWAPKPWKTETKTMDFREGGHWLYAMRGPEGETHWCRADYKSIYPQKSFSGLDAFCDDMGTVNPSFPRSAWNVDFQPSGESTRVNILIQFDSLADLETNIQMGFKEGFTAALENLDAIFAS
ncbi:MAG TPA: SRPBCC domain-containing protein [Saprospiraceae bacterium]|nr:SRPBCC domain-containing protein [Saprospiraceae bacterium]